ncbi:hypothetical protein H2198_002452 [Neophaeococcomyces mojaviensis]|uniref:Uncharacterized protein n=1 Tax=Neophaeococcomyces mojaviensis TaxID=3383035 RepID=A0ACC3AEF9_9EURO|nr:hypothetical protein H2198_002452 [Knufia sp. JES_112]
MSAPAEQVSHAEKEGTWAHDSHRNSLSRQVTVQLTPQQYERLFFQPTAAKGDLSRRLGNPTLLGLLGFLVPFSNTMFCLLGFQGASANSLAAIVGPWYFFGGIAMVLAGIGEFVLGNTFPFVVFTVYGVHWVGAAYTTDPWHPLTAAYGAEGGAMTVYTSGQGLYNVTMLLVSFIFTIGSLRTNVPFVITFVALDFLFAFFAAAEFAIGHNPTPEGLEHAAYLFKIAGGFGFVAVVMGWYLAIITVCASTGVPCPLPIFDLSTKVFRDSKAAANEHAGAVTETTHA